MASLIAENYGNTVILDKNLNDCDSKLKRMLQHFLKQSVSVLNRLKNTKKNFIMEQEIGDIFYVFNNVKQIQQVVSNFNYELSSPKNYIFEEYNIATSNKIIPFYEEHEDIFISNFSFHNKLGVKKEYSYFLKDNYIIFYSIDENKTDFFFNINEDTKIIDFKIDKGFFVFMVLEESGKRFFVKTHLGLEFAELNKENSKLNNKELFLKFQIDDLKKILTIDDEAIYYQDINDNVHKLTLDKNYYFIVNDKIYLPKHEKLRKYLKYAIAEEQVEMLHIYDYINMVGLNDFLVDNYFKLSTETKEIFNKLFTHKFDNTLNGGLNYFNAKASGISNDMITNLKSKDYQIFKVDDFFSITGNFFYNEGEKGKYKFKYNNNKIELFKYEKNKWVSVKFCFVNNLEYFYFCNLQFEKIAYEYPNDLNWEFEFEVKDDYLFKQKEELVKVFEIPNDDNVISQVIEASEYSDIDENKINVSFDGRKIIFNNYYDYNTKKYKYNHNERMVKANEKIDMTQIKLFEFNKSYQIKGKYIYFRDNGILKYSNVDKFVYELINENGYITKFWQDHQGKEVYFQNADNTITICEDKLNCDYKIGIPLIKDFIVSNSRIYNNVKIEDNDELSVDTLYSENLLITNKFFGEPLFFKFYIETNSLDDFHLFNSDEHEITNYISEKFNDGFLIYFNIEHDKKYYYHLGQNQEYIYIVPMKAFENISREYYFNDNGVISFNEVKNIKSFKIKTNTYYVGDISLYLYNTVLGKTYHILLNQNEINTKFDLDIDADRIQIEISQADFKSFSFIEESGTSSIDGQLITFFKKRDEQIYISEFENLIDFSNVNFTELKIDTSYNHSNNSFIESLNGNVLVKSLNKDSIPIYYNNAKDNYNTKLFISTLPIKDRFYENNFKSIGNFYRYNQNIIKDFAKSDNKHFEINNYASVID